MSRPADLPSADHFPHGTRARYVTGCRCADCKHSNVVVRNERNRLVRRLVMELPILFAVPVTRSWTVHGQTRWRTIDGCPGIDGAPCKFKSTLRSDSLNGRCARCRDRLAWNGLVDATSVRRHLRKLSKQGIGRDGVAGACGLSASTIDALRRGTQVQLRAMNARAILAVTSEVRTGSNSLVPAGPTWARLKTILKEGLTKRELARRLGSKAKVPALQLRTDLVTARNEMKVRRLFDRMYAE